MLGNFIYSNPTKLYFGEDSLQYLHEELPKYGSNVMLSYGGGSIKKNGIYEGSDPDLNGTWKEYCGRPGSHAKPHRRETV